MDTHHKDEALAIVAERKYLQILDGEAPHDLWISVLCPIADNGGFQPRLIVRQKGVMMQWLPGGELLARSRETVSREYVSEQRPEPQDLELMTDSLAGLVQAMSRIDLSLGLDCDLYFHPSLTGGSMERYVSDRAILVDQARVEFLTRRERQDAHDLASGSNQLRLGQIAERQLLAVLPNGDYHDVWVKVYIPLQQPRDADPFVVVRWKHLSFDPITVERGDPSAISGRYETCYGEEAFGAFDSVHAIMRALEWIGDHLTLPFGRLYYDPLRWPECKPMDEFTAGSSDIGILLAKPSWPTE